MLFGNISIPGCPDPENVRRLDLLILPQIRRMMRVGVAIDREWLAGLSDTLESKRTDLRKQIASYVPVDALDQFVGQSPNDLALNVDSAEQVADLLYKTLGVGLGRRLKRTKSGTRISTGKKQLETLKRDHPVIPLILEYREASKLKQTYTDRLPQQARYDPDTDAWRIHTQILTTRTDTSRLSSKSPNLQQIPARSELGREIRKAFIPSPGKRLVSVDFAQIELRMMAHMGQEPNMIKIFWEDGDIHIDTACRTFKLDYDHYLGLSRKKDANALSAAEKIEWKEFSLGQRAPSKNTNFSVGFGIQALGLYDLMAVTYATAGKPVPDWLTVEWCEKFIEDWFDIYPKMREYFALQHYRAARYGLVWTALGWVRLIPEVRSCHERVRAAGLRQAGCVPIQGLAAGVFKLGMARVESNVLIPARAQGVYAEALLPIHDELLIEVDEEWAEEVKGMVEYEMGQALVDEGTGELCCRVPIKADGAVMEYRWEKGA